MSGNPTMNGMWMLRVWMFRRRGGVGMFEALFALGVVLPAESHPGQLSPVYSG